MYLCILDADAEVVLHKNMASTDLCQREGIEFVLGHALYMRAIHGGKAKNDRIDAKKIAGLLRGGMTDAEPCT